MSFETFGNRVLVDIKFNFFLNLGNRVLCRVKSSFSKKEFYVE